MLTWLAGSVLCLSVTLIRFLRFRRWIRKQETIENEDIESRVNDLALQLKLRRKIRVRVIDAEFGPAIMGLRRPTIVLPHTLVAEKTPEELEPMLAHELIHFRRGDTYWSVLQVIACSLMWFHPLVWLASRNVTRESERCCDEETLANFECDRANYARMLVDVLEQKSRLRIAPVVPGVRPADVTSSRLEQIMESESGKRKRTPRWVWALALLIAFAVLPGAAIVQSQENRFSKTATKDTADPKPAFRSDDSRWQLVGEPDLTNAVPPPNRIANPQNKHIKNAFPSVNSGFNADATTAKFEASILEMCTDDEDEQEKLLKELKKEFWGNHTARISLQNCKNPQVDLEFRVARVPESLIGKTALGGKHPSGNQIPKAQVKELLELIAKTDDARISTVTTTTYLAGSNINKSVLAQLQRSFVSGVREFSILDPTNSKPFVQEQLESALLQVDIKKADGGATSLEGHLTFNKLNVSAGRKLPLKLGSNDIKIEAAIPVQSEKAFKWSLPEDKAQIILGTTDVESKSRMLVIVEALRKPPRVSKDEKLTLEHVLKIKKNYLAESTKSFDQSSPSVPIASNAGLDDKLETSESAKLTKPLSLVLQCGQANEERSLNTKIGLADKASLTIEGEVVSQQISVDLVQVSGRNFVFKNEEEGVFKAEAASGSISFKRGGPMKDTMRLTLRSDAKLSFAGIEFVAESIECYPDRIEAKGNVKVSIPEISSTVSAGRVIMNLKSLAFDFDDDVRVERNVGEDSFPFLVKGKHVGWSLVTGEMQTDQRHNQPRRSASGTGGLNRRASSASSAFGQSVLQQRQATASRFGNGRMDFSPRVPSNPIKPKNPLGPSLNQSQRIPIQPKSSQFGTSLNQTSKGANHDDPCEPKYAKPKLNDQTSLRMHTGQRPMPPTT